MREIVFHIGMGKTGTTSIQSALEQSSERLGRQGVEYLGMWFQDVKEEFRGLDGQLKMFRSSPEELQEYADIFLASLAQRQSMNGTQRFIFSNESLFENVSALKPFIYRIKSRVPVKIIAYARNPYDWLPSAYNQWGIYHKTGVGPIPEYGEMARSLVKVYASAIEWSKNFPSEFNLREFDKGIDVVEDFSKFINVDVENSGVRKLERARASEMLFRAIYNDKFQGSVLPQRFNASVGGARPFSAPSLDEVLKRSFDYGVTEDIVRDNFHIFENIRSLTGLDLYSRAGRASVSTDYEVLRSEVIDSLVRISMDLSEKVFVLEKKIRDMEGG